MKCEFATVGTLSRLDSREAPTRRVDGLILAWVKYEKQTRRLFTYLVLQHRGWDERACAQAEAAIARNEQLYPEHCLSGIEELAQQTLPDLLGAALHATLWAEVVRIKGYRNKIFHGQLTGQARTGPQLAVDIRHLIQWVESLAAAAQRRFGYNGLERGTRRLARRHHPQNITHPFATPADFETWLTRLTRRRPRWH